MKLQIALCFAVLVLSCIPVQAVSAQTTDWLTLDSQYFTVYYKEGHIADAQLMLGYCSYARDVVEGIYPHQLNFKVTVHLYDFENWTLTRSVYSTYASSSLGAVDLSFLTPSEVPQSAKYWVDNLWYQFSAVHEYVHAATYQDLLRTQYYHNGNSPQWFTEGAAQYVATFCTTPEICQKEVQGHSYINEWSKILSNNSGSLFFLTGDIYFSSTYIMKYVYETYSSQKVAALFKSNATKFWDAVNQTLGVTQTEFENKWVVGFTQNSIYLFLSDTSAAMPLKGSTIALN
jgi:hypothetical protein